MLRLAFFILSLLIFSSSALAQNANDKARIYQTSFESIGDFNSFYIVPQNYKGSASHDQSQERVRSGKFSHKGWINKNNPAGNVFDDNNHRGYPTIQLYKLKGGAFRTPVKIEFWVWLDMELKKGEWFSFATLDHTTKDSWNPVLVNLSDEGFVHLMHVPKFNMGRRTFQTSTIKFPMRQWVRLTIELHFDKKNGYAKVWQNGKLVSSANVRSGNGLLTQAHFGLYAPPSVASGIIYNDDLRIRELKK